MGRITRVGCVSTLVGGKVASFESSHEAVIHRSGAYGAKKVKTERDGGAKLPSIGRAGCAQSVIYKQGAEGYQ